jgi:hypothetical protein
MVVIAIFCGCVTMKKMTIVAITFFGGFVAKKAMIECHYLLGFLLALGGFTIKKGDNSKPLFFFSFFGPFVANFL